MILKLVPRRPKGSGGARCQLGLAGMGGLPTPRVFLPGFPDLLSLAGGGEMGRYSFPRLFRETVQIPCPPPSAWWKACRQKSETARPGCKLVGVTPLSTLVLPVGSA